MTTTLLVWLLVALAMTIVVLFRPVKSVLGYLRRSHLIEVGKESEEIWLPGDKLPFRSGEYDDED